MSIIAPFRAFPNFVRDLGKNKRGNVLMIVAFSVVPLTLAGGIGVDYARAARLQTKLNSAADAASLAAVSQTMMKQDNATARSAAMAMFKSQIVGQPGLIWNDADLTVTITGNNAATTTRTAVITYLAKSVNAFSGIIGAASITIGGNATATATAAPNIDFYLALDTSPSMALPTTSDGFTKMDVALQCAFACHSNKIQNYVGPKPASIPTLILDNSTFSLVKGSYATIGPVGNTQKQPIDANGAYVYVNRNADSSNDPLCKMNPSQSSSKNICVYNSDNSYADSYWWALNQGVRLRVTDEKIAARDLMTLAQSYAAANSRSYRAALYTFDHSTDLKKIAPLGTTPVLSSDLASIGTAADNISLVTVNDKSLNGRSPSNEVGTEYLFTSFKSILSKMLTELPAASGKGSNDPGDTPQAFVFLVTDGMSDENIGSGRTRNSMQQAQIDQCTTIKNRGIQIAILYTEYTVESIKDDEVGQRNLVTPRIPDVAPQLTKCASPGLLYTVKTDQSISEALQALFARAVASARLSS